MTRLHVFLYQSDESGAVFLTFEVANAGNEAELLDGSRLLGSQRMKHLVTEDDVGWEPFFLGTLAP